MLTIWQAVGLAGGGLLTMLGLWVMRAARTQIRRLEDEWGSEQAAGGETADAATSAAASDPALGPPPSATPTEAERYAARLWRGWSPPTRYAIGILLMVLGYHAASYAAPAGWLPLRVPPDRWWVLAVASGAVAVGVLLCEAIERPSEPASGG